MVLYDAPRDAGGGCYLQTFSVVPSGAQFTLCTDHSSLRWLQKFRNGDGMLARWYMLLGQLSVTFEYCPGAQHANADGMSRQCGQCSRPDCPVPSSHLWVIDVDSTTVRMFGTVSGAAVLAVADRELISGHGREIVAPPGSSVRGLSTRATRSGASGDDSSIS